MTRMRSNPTPPAGLTPLGKLLSFLLIAGLIGAGIWVFTKRRPAGESPTVTRTEPATSEDAARSTQREATSGDTPAPEGVTEAMRSVPGLAPAAPYRPDGDTIDIELSEYAGYAGLIVANGGLEPDPDSIFAKKHGFKLRIKLSEEDSWSALNAGKMAASATTADVLAVYGRQMQVVVPAQIGFSRGADGVIVRSDIKRINSLKGKTLVAAQFNEADFFLRYLAQEAGLAVNMLESLDAQPDAEKVNVVYAEDAFVAGDVFLADLNSGANRLAGCVTWAPKTTEVVEAAGGKATLLTTNRNLLIIADILIVNRGFARDNPKMVAGLVEGLLEGNKMVRDNASAHRDTIGKAFKWDREETQAELAKVHLSNLPENLAFFRGEIDAAGSFGGIYQSAVYAYGDELIPEPAPADRFVDLSHLEAIEKSGAFKDQKVAIAPIRSEGSAAPLEDNPLLSKDIRFFFLPNSTELDMSKQENLANLASIKELLQVSPGSTILLRGHVDNAMVETFRKEGILREMSLRAVQMSKERAEEVKRRLIERHQGVDPKRLEVVGRGWDEPVSDKSDENRRVEVQWFLIE